MRRPNLLHVHRVCHVGCVCLPLPPTNPIRHCFLEQTAAWVEIYVNILKGTLAQKFICAGSDVKLTPLIIFNLFANQDPRRTLKGSWILTWAAIAGLAFFVLRFFFFFSRHRESLHISSMGRRDIVVNTANIAKGSRCPRSRMASLGTTNPIRTNVFCYCK